MAESVEIILHENMTFGVYKCHKKFQHLNKLLTLNNSDKLTVAYSRDQIILVTLRLLCFARVL